MILHLEEHRKPVIVAAASLAETECGKQRIRHDPPATEPHPARPGPVTSRACRSTPLRREDDIPQSQRRVAAAPTKSTGFSRRQFRRLSGIYDTRRFPDRHAVQGQERAHAYDSNSSHSHSNRGCGASSKRGQRRQGRQQHERAEAIEMILDEEEDVNAAIAVRSPLPLATATLPYPPPVAE